MVKFDISVGLLCLLVAFRVQAESFKPVDDEASNTALDFARVNEDVSSASDGEAGAVVAEQPDMTTMANIRVKREGTTHAAAKEDHHSAAPASADGSEGSSKYWQGLCIECSHSNRPFHLRQLGALRWHRWRHCRFSSFADRLLVLLLRWRRWQEEQVKEIVVQEELEEIETLTRSAAPGQEVHHLQTLRSALHCTHQN